MWKSSRDRSSWAWRCNRTCLAVTRAGQEGVGDAGHVGRCVLMCSSWHIEAKSSWRIIKNKKKYLGLVDELIERVWLPAGTIRPGSLQSLSGLYLCDWTCTRTPSDLSPVITFSGLFPVSSTDWSWRLTSGKRKPADLWSGAAGLLRFRVPKSISPSYPAT